MGSMKPWTARAIERVQDGPVPFDQLVADMMEQVPPGRGYREAQRGVELQRDRNNYRVRDYAVGEDVIRQRRIRSGQRQIAMDALQGLLERGRVELVEEDGKKLVKAGDDTYLEVSLRRALTPTSKALMRAVAGGPVNLEGVLKGIVYTVPVDKAIQRRQVTVNNRRINYVPVSSKRPKRRELSESEQYLIGARQVVLSNLRVLTKTDRIAVSGDGASRVISRGSRWYDPDASGA